MVPPFIGALTVAPPRARARWQSASGRCVSAPRSQSPPATTARPSRRPAGGPRRAARRRVWCVRTRATRAPRAYTRSSASTGRAAGQVGGQAVVVVELRQLVLEPARRRAAAPRVHVAEQHGRPLQLRVVEQLVDLPLARAVDQRQVRGDDRDAALVARELGGDRRALLEPRERQVEREHRRERPAREDRVAELAACGAPASRRRPGTGRASSASCGSGSSAPRTAAAPPAARSRRLSSSAITSAASSGAHAVAAARPGEAVHVVGGDLEHAVGAGAPAAARSARAPPPGTARAPPVALRRSASGSARAGSRSAQNPHGFLHRPTGDDSGRPPGLATRRREAVASSREPTGERRMADELRSGARALEEAFFNKYERGAAREAARARKRQHGSRASWPVRRASADSNACSTTCSAHGVEPETLTALALAPIVAPGLAQGHGRAGGAQRDPARRRASSGLAHRAPR